jgi:hypothetical protein
VQSLRTIAEQPGPRSSTLRAIAEECHAIANSAERVMIRDHLRGQDRHGRK